MTRLTIFKYALALVYVLACIEPQAQEINLGTPPIRNFSKKIYNAGIQNWDAAQDSHGRLYWANNDGLLHFDGKYWQCLPVANNTIVRSVAIDSSDRIFIGAQGELGYFYANQNGCLQYTSLNTLLPLEQQAFEDVWDIVFFDSSVFFRTNKEVFQYTDGKIKIHSFSGSVESMVTSNMGLVVQLNYSALFLFSDDTFRPYLQLADLKSPITGSSQWIGDTTIFSTLKNGLFSLSNHQLNKWATMYDDYFKEKRIYTSTKLPNGHLAIGTSLEGLIVLDNKRRVYKHLTKKSGLQNNNILHTFCDRTGTLWLGLDNGIDCVVLDSPFSSIIPDGDLQGTGYTASVFQGHLFLGVSNGVYTVPWKPNYELERKSVYQKISGTEGQVWSLTQVDEDLIMGHHEGSFMLKTDNANRLSKEPGAWTYLKIGENYMLAGTYTGIESYRKTSTGWAFEHKLKGLNESCRIMVKDQDGTLWISHPYRGLFHASWSPAMGDQLGVKFYNQEHGLPSNLNNYVFSIAGITVVATEKGIYTFDKEAESFSPHEDFNKLLGSSSRVKYLREDQEGNIWYVTDVAVGLIVVNDSGLKKIITKKVFPELSGKLVGGFEFILPIDSQNVLFGTEQGFIHYNIATASTAKTEFEVLITNIQASGRADSMLFGGFDFLQKDQGQNEIPVLEWAMNTLSFTYAASEFKNPDLIQYRIKLLGLEEEWSNWSTETKRHFTRLGPGSYTFQVQARLIEGMESEIASYTFKIKPPWYKSNIAYTLYGLGLAGLFLGFTFHQRRKFETEKAQMAEIHQFKEEKQRRAVESTKAALAESEKEKLEVEIKYKNQELAMTTMHLVQKAEILLSIQEGLTHLKEKSSHPAIKKEIQTLLNLLNFDVKLDDDWEQFAFHFDQVHVDFLKQLQESFPQLGPNDYKLCAYLRMNLSTKEIAPLMNISVRGVEGSRYRLRRKLNLPNDVNLTEFILGIMPIKES